MATQSRNRAASYSSLSLSWYCCCLLQLLLLLASVGPRSTAALTCVCNRASCAEPRGCRGSAVLDVCRCCLVCARQAGETCGGTFALHGTCDRGLRCAAPTTPSAVFGFEPGYCQVVPPSCNGVRCAEAKPPLCPPDSALRGGEQAEGECCPRPSRCECEPERCVPTVCQPGHRRVLLSHATGQPGDCCPQYGCTAAAVGLDCSQETCSLEQDTACPPDSFAVFGGGMSGDGCCPQPSRCECPGVCELLRCEAESEPRLITAGDGNPGSCCDVYECTNETKATCTFNGAEYGDGEMYRMDACRFCRCRNGVSFCFSAQCGTLACQRHYVPDGECCPVCEEPEMDTRPSTLQMMCFANGQIRANGDRWREDDCTFCQCVSGEQHCTAASCQVSCLKPISVPGECCPVCEEPTVFTIQPPVCKPVPHCELAEDDCLFGFKLDKGGCRTCLCKSKAEHCRALMTGCSLECPHGHVLNARGCEVCECRPRPKKCRPVACYKTCPHGYLKNKHGCEVCRCAKCPDFSCDKECPFGYTENSKGCHLCRCKEAAKSGAVATTAPPSPRSPPPPVVAAAAAGGRCLSMDGRRYAERESWHDGCRECYCHGGREMCALIACPVPRCAILELRPGQCCPGCGEGEAPGERVDARAAHAVCQAPGGEYYVEGESWSADACTRCACHAGRVLCDTAVCPPLLCAEPLRNKGSCCPSCPDVAESPQQPGNGSESVYCVSKEGDVFLAGEAWKPDLCRSCVCQEGFVRCYTETCPPVACKRPVLRKGQCCPYCLEVVVPLKVCFFVDEIYGEGERWSLDPCTHCHCRNGEAVCTVEDCLVPACSQPLLHEGSCCPVCPDDELSGEPTNVPVEKYEDDGRVRMMPPAQLTAVPPPRARGDLDNNSILGASRDASGLEGGGNEAGDLWLLQPITWVVIALLSLGLAVVLLVLTMSRRRQWIPLQLYKTPVKTVYLHNEAEKNANGTKVPLNNMSKVPRLADPDPRCSGYYSMVNAAAVVATPTAHV
ncbi:cysteine-rich motor neuron 1 protein-like [Petromyzon marinus]|uniref:cysteine-rich motor neuron 1 protein-like n=1 Tax=Petromyzon marinus TaxID=7757 RepID=UPI003F72178E